MNNVTATYWIVRPGVSGSSSTPSTKVVPAMMIGRS
jgi:hypothetical protein